MGHKKAMRVGILCWLAFYCFVLCSGSSSSSSSEGEVVGRGEVELVELVRPSGIHGLHGLTVHPRDEDLVFVGSVFGGEIYRIRVSTKETELYVPAPDGDADDMEFSPDGELFFTSIFGGEVRRRRERGENAGKIDVIAKDLPGPNSIAFDPQGRLFVGCVFLGDALYDLGSEFSYDNTTETTLVQPKEVLRDLGGLNGFDFSADGYLYGPEWFNQKVVKIDVDKGIVSDVSKGFGIPAAANFDSKGDLYVLDTQLGQVEKVDLSTGQREVILRTKPTLDNLALDSSHSLYFTDMTVAGVYKLDLNTRSVETLTESVLVAPISISAIKEQSMIKLYVADFFSVKVITPSSTPWESTTTRLESAFAPNIGTLFPSGVHVSNTHLYLLDWFAGKLSIHERSNLGQKRVLRGLSFPIDIIQLNEETVLITNFRSGEVVAVSTTNPTELTKRIVVKGLDEPAGIAAVPGDSQHIYLSEHSRGTIIKANINDGTTSVIFSGLVDPEGIDVTPDGKIVVAEVGRKQLVLIDPQNPTTKQILAVDLPIGLSPFPKDSKTLRNFPSLYVLTDVVISDSADKLHVFVTSDVKNTILHFTLPKNPAMQNHDEL